MSIAYGAVYGYHDSIYTVGHKNTPNFFGQNFKKGYSILIFLVHIFMTQLAIKWPFSFPPHPASVSALSEKNRTEKRCIKINNKKL